MCCCSWFHVQKNRLNPTFQLQKQTTIFNRWGQLIVSGDEKSLQYEGDVDGGYYICWDGTHKGETVGNGTYYIRIDAIGAGGKRYTRRSDINVLLGVGD